MCEAEIADVPLCRCTNDELEQGKTCGAPTCPNYERKDRSMSTSSPFTVHTPDGIPHAFPMTHTLEDVRVAARAMANEAGTVMHIHNRLTGIPVEDVAPEPPNETWEADANERAKRVGRYVVPLAVEIDADLISDVNDDAFGNVLMSLPGVVAVTSGGVLERTTGDPDRTVWADVIDALQP